MLHEALGEAKQILTDEQLERFVEIIREDAVWYDFFYTELTTGLRRGEICGLQWRDFDADDGRLKICRAVHEERGGKLTTWDTKTSAGARTITLPPSTVELLRERKKSALTEWIFPHPWKPEQPTHPSTAYDRLKALLKRAELPDIRFHGLHHPNVKHKTKYFHKTEITNCQVSWKFVISACIHLIVVEMCFSVSLNAHHSTFTLPIISDSRLPLIS